MAEKIYAKAANAVVWLNSENLSLRYAMDILVGIDQEMPTVEDFTQLWQGLEVMFNLEYWARVWILQEYTLTAHVYSRCRYSLLTS
jgi:hypothetical protein